MDLEKEINFYKKGIALLFGNVYFKDKNLHYVWCNNNFAKILNLSDPSDIEGKTDYDFLNKKEADAIANNDRKVMNEKKQFNKEEKGIDKNGKEAFYLSIKIPLCDEEEPVGILGISIDITDRKLAEELKIKNEAAEKVIKFMNLMAGSMAHELRTPLSSINTYADLFKNELLSNNSKEEKENFCLGVYKKIKLIIKSTNHMINDMLFKLRSFAVGKLPQSNFIKLKMSDSIKKFMNSFPFEEKEKEVIKIIANEDFIYSGDELLTEHVLTNLVKNALKVIRENGWKGDLTIELRTDNNYNKLIVRDTAIGIPKEYLPKIFDQFETTNSKSGGTGLGLAFCKMVMEYYGGTIKCNSKEGKYTEFVMSFPKVG